MKRPLLTLLCLLSLHMIAPAQSMYSLHDSTRIMLYGTSTIHDWTVTVGDVEAEFDLGDAFENGPTVGAEISSTMLSIPVKSLDGGRGSTMNDKIFKAFKEPQNPQIVYQLDRAEITEVSGLTFKLNASGTLSMAGVTKPVELVLEGKKWTDGSIEFTGMHRLKMTEYGMEVPTAMFGQIVAGDNVTVMLKLVVRK